MANGGAPLERLGLRFLDCEAGWICFAMEALSPEWHTRCTHLNDPFADMLRWLGEIVSGETVARWQVAEEGFAVQFVYMPPSCNPHGESTGILIQTGSNEEDLYYSWSCAIDPQCLVLEVYTLFRSFVESTSYKPAEWEWNGVDEDDLPDLFDLDTDEFKFFEARLPVWNGYSLRFLRSQRIENFLAGQAPASPPRPHLPRVTVRALLKVRAQLAAIERGVLPFAFFRGPMMHHTPRFDVHGRPSMDGAYGPVWRRMWRAFGMAGLMAPAKCAGLASNTDLERLADPDDCATLNWTETATLLVSMRQYALADESDAPSFAEVKLFGAIVERILYFGL